MADLDLSVLIRGVGWAGDLCDLPLKVLAVAPDLTRPAIPKGQVGRHYQAISRNGRVLILTDVSLTELQGRLALFTLYPWRYVLLPGEAPEVRGVMLRVLTRLRGDVTDGTSKCRASVVREPDPEGFLSLDLGGRAHLLFQPEG